MGQTGSNWNLKIDPLTGPRKSQGEPGALRSLKWQAEHCDVSIGPGGEKSSSVQMREGTQKSMRYDQKNADQWDQNRYMNALRSLLENSGIPSNRWGSATKVESPAERECKPFLQGVVQMASYQHWIKKAQQTQIKCLFPASFGKRSPTLYWCPWGSVDQHPSKLLCGPTWTAGVAPGPHMGDWSPSEAVHELRPYGVSLVLLFRGAVMGLVWWWNPKQDDDNWSCGSSGRVPALQVWSPEFEL
jgi:hypothetical protein